MKNFIKALIIVSIGLIFTISAAIFGNLLTGKLILTVEEKNCTINPPLQNN